MNEKYEDYEESLDTAEYDSPDNSSRNKKILLIILVIIGIILIILLLKACGNGNGKFDYEKTLLEAGKEYYEYNGNEKPKAKSSCKIVTLNQLISEGLIDPDNYSDCDGNETYVKVCLLENSKEHYVPILTCDSINSDDLYEEFEEGKLSDIISDETDIEFAYLGQAIKENTGEVGDTVEVWYGDNIPYENYKLLNKITYYRYQDLQYKWYETTKLYAPNNTTSGGRELFISSPSSGYDKKENGQTAYKWFKITAGGEKEYCGGKYRIDNRPAECPYADPDPIEIIYGKTRSLAYTTPIVEPFAAKKIYKCIESEYQDKIGTPEEASLIFSLEYNTCGSPSNNHPEHDYEVETFYSCYAGGSRVPNDTVCRCTLGDLRPDGSVCALYGVWLENKTAPCTGLSDVCENYSTPERYYKWYKYIGEVKSYYPSGSANATGEKTFYAQSPETGYEKDTTSETTAWNWYKEVTSITGNYMSVAPSPNATKSSDSRWTEWTEWSTNSVQGLGSAGTRKIETKVKLQIQEIKNSSKDDYENVTTEYIKETSKLVKAFQDKGYEVESLEDIAMNGELKYLVKMYIRNKK